MTIDVLRLAASLVFASIMWRKVGFGPTSLNDTRVFTGLCESLQSIPASLAELMRANFDLCVLTPHYLCVLLCSEGETLISLSVMFRWRDKEEAKVCLILEAMPIRKSGGNGCRRCCETFRGVNTIDLSSFLTWRLELMLHRKFGVKLTAAQGAAKELVDRCLIVNSNDTVVRTFFKKRSCIKL